MQNADYKDSVNLDAQGLSKGGRETLRLRLFFLAPLTLMIVLTGGLLVFIFYSHEQDELRNGVLRVQASAMDLYQDSIRTHAEALQTLLEILERDQILHAALEREDRAALLEKSGLFFADMHRMFGITHMYFTRPDAVNLLRVHQPERSGDVIDRFTTQEAKRTVRRRREWSLGRWAYSP